jgi:hypothetical protein
MITSFHSSLPLKVGHPISKWLSKLSSRKWPFKRTDRRWLYKRAIENSHLSFLAENSQLSTMLVDSHLKPLLTPIKVHSAPFATKRLFPTLQFLQQLFSSLLTISLKLIRATLSHQDMQQKHDFETRSRFESTVLLIIPLVGD